jgi:lysozyme
MKPTGSGGPVANLTVSPKGLHLIKSFEGFRGKPYLCPAGVWTIGYGTTSGVTEHTPPITEAQASALLSVDVAKFAAGVADSLTRAPTQGQFDAMVSLAYNIGLGAFRRSRVLKWFNLGDDDEAAAAFRAWQTANGQVLAGLVRRREAEIRLFKGVA